MTSFNVGPFYSYNKEHNWTVQRQSQIFEKEYFSFMCMADYPFKINEFCCHGTLFLCQLPSFYEYGVPQ